MFGRKKKQAAEATPEAAPENIDAVGSSHLEADDVRAAGPFDVSEVANKDDYLDLGAVLIKPQEGVGLRLEVDEKSKRPRAVNLDLAGSTAQIQAFAAPKKSGLWEEIRADLTESLNQNNGAPEALEGTFGTELRARFPAKTSDGTTGYRPARFVGIDGPRWFLRVVISGAAALDPEASRKLDEIIRGVVVVRGQDPMPPRDLLPLKVPEGAQRVRAGKSVRRAGTKKQPAAGTGTGNRAEQPNTGQTNTGQASAGQSGAAPSSGSAPAKRWGSSRPTLQPPERGPEVTETR